MYADTWRWIKRGNQYSSGELLLLLPTQPKWSACYLAARHQRWQQEEGFVGPEEWMVLPEVRWIIHRQQHVEDEREQINASTIYAMEAQGPPNTELCYPQPCFQAFSRVF